MTGGRCASPSRVAGRRGSFAAAGQRRGEMPREERTDREGEAGRWGSRPRRRPSPPLPYSFRSPHRFAAGSGRPHCSSNRTAISCRVPAPQRVVNQGRPFAPRGLFPFPAMRAPVPIQEFSNVHPRVVYHGRTCSLPTVAIIASLFTGRRLEVVIRPEQTWTVCPPLNPLLPGRLAASFPGGTRLLRLTPGASSSHLTSAK